MDNALSASETVLLNKILDVDLRRQKRLGISFLIGGVLAFPVVVAIGGTWLGWTTSLIVGLYTMLLFVLIGRALLSFASLYQLIKVLGRKRHN